MGNSVNRLMYWVMVAIARHLDRINTADETSVGNDWRSFLSEWDGWQPPYPAARKALR